MTEERVRPVYFLERAHILKVREKLEVMGQRREQKALVFPTESHFID